ncbi:MAG: ParB/RepB/Spo0J family partition protein [Campylobacterales bacterium]|nr:ParB/RepB/Spo0J family partition protein [Campylobacterales bacterium]HEO99498.1 ParB/RepB/Spo0J family partition protein [Campylobacterota bacterium]
MALGRGLGEILSEVEEAYAKDISSIDSSELEAQGVRIAEIEVSSISPNPFQPRKYFDEQALQELSESIKEHGLLQPIVVIEKGDGYMLIAGERRLRAHKLADLPVVKAIIADVEIDDIRLRELALIENIQRENLNPIELANSYAELIEVHGIRHEDLSEIVHKSRSQITNTMRLLTLSDYAQKQVAEGNISQGHAKVLVGLDVPKQKRIIDTIVGQKLSVREAENIVKNYKNNHETKLKAVVKTALLDDYRSEISALLPFRHKIKSKSVEISFTSTEEIENFLSILKKA